MMGIWLLFLIALVAIVVTLAVIWIVSRRRGRQPRGFDVRPIDQPRRE